MKYVCCFTGRNLLLRKAGGRPNQDAVPLVRPARCPLGRGGASAGQRPSGRYGIRGLRTRGAAAQRRDDLGRRSAQQRQSGRPGSVAEVRRLIFEGRYKEARPVRREFLLHASHGMPYRTAGSLLLDFPGHRNVSDFYRDLDLATATATVGYAVDGIRYKREMFTSFPIRWRSCG